MPVEEVTELRDSVVQTLQRNGILGKVQAEIRASVFLALEEQDVFKDKSPYLNRKLKEFVNKQDGAILVSLVREFLEFFNLEFSAMVFDPETHAGTDYKYEGRTNLAKELSLNPNLTDKSMPLLGHLLLPLDKHNIPQSSKENADLPKDDALKNKEVNKEPLPNGPDSIHNGNGFDEALSSPIEKESTKDCENKPQFPQPTKKVDPISLEKKAKSVTGGLSSLGGLPPLAKNEKSVLEEEPYVMNDDVKRILDFRLGDSQYEEDFMSSPSEKGPIEIKRDSPSEESEIEEELSSPSNISVPADDVTADITISKSSGQGDYMEDVK